MSPIRFPQLLGSPSPNVDMRGRVVAIASAVTRAANYTQNPGVIVLYRVLRLTP